MLFIGNILLVIPTKMFSLYVSVMNHHIMYWNASSYTVIVMLPSTVCLNWCAGTVVRPGKIETSGYVGVFSYPFDAIVST